MNWIKITPETELPKRKQPILFYSESFVYKGAFNGKDMFFSTETGLAYSLFEVTHFMIITNPEE